MKESLTPQETEAIQQQYEQASENGFHGSFSFWLEIYSGLRDDETEPEWMKPNKEE